MSSMSDDEYVTVMKHKIEFLKKRFNYLNILKVEHIAEFNSFILKIYDEYDFEPPVSDNTIYENKSDESNSAVGGLYRKLSLVCHPDKIINDNGDFVRLQQYNKNNDLYQLVCMADEYHVDTSNMDIPNIYIILEKKLYELNRDIDTITKSEYYPFIIGDATGIENIRNNLVTNIEYYLKYRKLNDNLRKENDDLQKVIDSYLK